MFKPRRPKLSWLFALLCFVYFPTFGMYFVDDSLMDRTYELDELRKEFKTILEMQPKIIYLDSSESQYKTSNGIYKLIPYYEKICPELTSTDIKSSRFIIHKHVISGQWQLTEFDSYPLSKIIKALPVTEENEKNALLNNHFIKYNEIQELKKKLFNVKMEIKSKNDTTKFLTNENKILISFVDKQRRQLAKQIQIEKELELKLIYKENSCFDLEERLIATEKEFLNLSKIKAFPVTEEDEENALVDDRFIQSQNIIQEMQKEIMNMQSEVTSKNETIESLKNQKELLTLFVDKTRKEMKKKDETQKEMESKLIEKENQIHDFLESQKELKSKLIEKENNIRDFHKTQNQLETKLIEKNNQIRNFEKLEKKFQTKLLEQKNKIHDFEKKNLETIKKSKEDLKLFENENQINKEKLSKYQKLNEKLEFENKKLKSCEKLLDKKIEDLCVSNHTFKKNSKETKNNLQKYKLQQLQTKEEILKFKPNLFQNVETQQEEETEKVETLNKNHHDESTEKFKLDFKIERKVLLNLEQINTEKIKEEENFDSKIEVEESQTPKMEITSTSKQKSKNSKVRTKLNFQSNDGIFEKKQESVKADEYENKQILENKIILQEENPETKLLENTPTKKHIGFLNLITAQVAKQDKQKENLQRLSESQIEEKQESSASKDQKKKEILENPSISQQNIDTLYKEATRFQDGLISMKQMHENIKNFYSNELHIGEKQESSISQNQKKKDILNNGLKDIELKCLKNVQISEELMKKDGNKKITQLLINRISQILHGSRPSNLNFSKTMLDESHVVIKNQIEQHKLLVEDACERLKNFNDEALSSKITLFLVEKEEMQNVLKDVQQNVTDEEFSKIALFLETQNSLKNANYQYELLFMHHGSIMLLIEKFVDFRSQKYFTEFGNTYRHILEKIYQKYRKIQFDELLIVEDQKTKIKIKCFQDNRNLYYAPQYKYEMMFMIIGFIYSAGDILNELVNQIKTF